jgi:hypothetical protein
MIVDSGSRPPPSKTKIPLKESEVCHYLGYVCLLFVAPLISDLKFVSSHPKGSSFDVVVVC